MGWPGRQVGELLTGAQQSLVPFLFADVRNESSSSHPALGNAGRRRSGNGDRAPGPGMCPKH